jgi:hypothetical protein
VGQIAALAEGLVRRLLEPGFLHAQPGGQVADRVAPGRRLGHQELQVPEGDRVEQHAHPAVLAQGLGQLVAHPAALLRVESVGVEAQELRPGAANLLELGLDARHRGTPVAVDDAQVHPVLRQLLGRGEPEAAGSAQDHRPLVR